METRTVHLDSLLTDGLFDIPSYQRSYSWRELQLQDLLEDLLYLPKGKTHFFGNIILDKQEEQFRTDRGRRFEKFDVVDGQQRLTSAVIFLHVAAQFDDTVANTLDEDNLLFPVTERPRLLPQDQDKEYFRDSLLGSATIETETPSQDRLKQAYEFFEHEFQQLDDGRTIQKLVEKLRYDCRINVVEIDDESEAASIFESLNDRGRSLSTLDKTKSFLMYMDDRSSNNGALEEKIKDRFGSIYRELFVLTTGHERVNDFDEDSFLRFHWGIYDGYDSNEYFNGFETLKNRLREQYRAGDLEQVQKEIDHYVQDLREAASAFAAIFEPKNRPEKVQPLLTELLELGRLANVLPVLMASYLRFGDDEPEAFAKIIKACETLVFRMYAIDSRRSDTGRGRLVRLAHEIHNDRSLEPPEIVMKIDTITDRYTSDDRFERNLRDPGFYNSTTSRDAKYLLYKYGQQIDSEAGEEVLKDVSHILSPEFQVEHILARQLPEAAIPENLVGEFDEHVHRLGNLTIASRYWNSSYGNLPFAEKKRASGSREKDYESSALRVQRELADYKKFFRVEIDGREDILVEFALENWSIEPPEIEQSIEDVPEDFVGYFPPSFFERLTNKQEAMFRILYDAEAPIGTDELIQRIEEEYGETVDGSSGLSGILAGLTAKHSKEFRRSIMPAQWMGDQYEWRLALDEEQEQIFKEKLKIER
ncbi:DUF262 domain-containing protein [Haladaptatus caseinilyticus]|uniref:DUF262 domain-containing protein n=1 Tax=Haladaptatus caseinilyticus TaxID=2993314 RepID=UPI00224ADD2E|nr:DUF262 domain-containing protein [Haladaptatus caseinilyticus]